MQQQLLPLCGCLPFFRLSYSRVLKSKRRNAFIFVISLPQQFIFTLRCDTVWLLCTACKEWRKNIGKEFAPDKNAQEFLLFIFSALLMISFSDSNFYTLVLLFFSYWPGWKLLESKESGFGEFFLWTILADGFLQQNIAKYTKKVLDWRWPEMFIGTWADIKLDSDYTLRWIVH